VSVVHGSTCSDVKRPAVGERTFPWDWIPAVPFKLNQNRRRHIPRQRHKVTNLPTYEAGLRQRGSLTVTDDAIAAWAVEPRTTGGGQAWYSPLVILTALTLRAVFRLAYRQAEGLIGSIKLARSDGACTGTCNAEPSFCDAGGAEADVDRRRWMPSPSICWWTARG
jgi:hypothetical protein